MPVRRLPEALANQIAAGEVVERPASVVKELVENALDAGARRVDVQVEDGGRRLVRVVDDGAGMSREDALLSLERHTTSKVSSAEDLFGIRTFGFRGEALPSIASVSRFTLATRRPEDLAATRIAVEGGRVVSVEEAGAPAGTRVEVADLFFNVPARLKFLKSRPTELGHVTDWLVRLGLANPAVGFVLAEQGRGLLRAEPTSDPRERIAALLGRELFDTLYAVDGHAGDVRVTGWAAGPQRANTTGREIFTFVNGRYVRDRALLHAVSRAYEGVLPVGRSPACVLFLELPAHRVDVNVHPQKLEVRFADQGAVWDAVAKALAYTLSSSPWLARSPAPSRTYVLRPAEPVPTPEPDPSPAEAAPPPTQAQQRIADALARWTERNIPESGPFSDPRPPAEPPVEPAAAPVVPPAAPSKLVFSELRFLGQLHRTYLVCESPEGLVLLDQHAAHERILYERLRSEQAQGRAPGQPLLVPVTLELAPSEARLVESARDELAELGFDLEPFGGSTFSLKAVPALAASEPARMVKELAAELRQTGRADAARAARDALLARMACHGAVRAGDPMAVEEVAELLRQLDGTPWGAQCPHGRPVVVRFGADALRELFGRTYAGTPRAAARERVER